MIGISKEKSLRNHHQWDHQYIHASGATLDNKWLYDPSIFGYGFLKTKARILGFSDVGVGHRVGHGVYWWSNGDDQRDNRKAITGTIIEMITELTGDWIGDWIGNQTEMINEMTMEMTLEMIPELTGDQAEIGDQDGCPLTRTHTLGGSEACHKVSKRDKGCKADSWKGWHTYLGGTWLLELLQNAGLQWHWQELTGASPCNPWLCCR